MRKFHGIIVLSVAIEAKDALDATETAAAMISDVTSSDRAEVIKVTTDLHAHRESEALSDVLGSISEMMGGRK
jgi:hypothetical protein